MTDELRAKFEAWALSAGLILDAVYASDAWLKCNVAWCAWQASRASRDAEVEALKTKVAWMREYEKGLNRRAEVEEVLFEVTRGKRAPLSADECRKLAIKLGVKSKGEGK